MLEQDLDQKADRRFAAAPALRIGISPTSDPQEGARLVRAFLGIADPAVRSAIVQMIEKMSSAAADC